MVLFAGSGPENTAQTLACALDAARRHKIQHLLVASNTGKTAWALLEAAADLTPRPQLVCVSHVCEFVPGCANELSNSQREKLIAHGCRVLTSAHALSGAQRAFSKAFGGVGPVEVAAHTLRLFGQGTKVAVEIALMARDAGLVPADQAVIAIGGTAGGADTALLLTPATSARMLDTRIHTILCKPGLWTDASSQTL